MASTKKRSRRASDALSTDENVVKPTRKSLKIVDMHAAPAADMDGLSEYEKQRQKNIAHNKAVLQDLGFEHAIEALGQTAATTQPVVLKKSAPRNPSKKKANTVITERRISTRSTRSNPSSDLNNEQDVANHEDLEKPSQRYLTPMAEYFKSTMDKAVYSDGHYKGWVNPETLAKYGIANNAKDAWETNGGGKFSFKNMCGDMGSVNVGARPAGWSNIRHISSKMLKKNPNAYFYRHTEPGVPQYQGDWTPEEHDLFLKAAAEFGCGDKWGLFSTYIPHRVGYQCSNYYRSVILPQGLVIDPCYLMDGEGKPVYIGNSGPSESASDTPQA